MVNWRVRVRKLQPHQQTTWYYYCQAQIPFQLRFDSAEVPWSPVDRVPNLRAETGGGRVDSVGPAASMVRRLSQFSRQKLAVRDLSKYRGVPGYDLINRGPDPLTEAHNQVTVIGGGFHARRSQGRRGCTRQHHDFPRR